MINPNFVLIGVFLQFLGGSEYLIQTIKGSVKPNRVTWFLWAFAPLIAFSAEIQKGVGIQSLMTFIVGFMPLLVFIASFLNIKSEWKMGKLDWICGGLSVLGLILWFFTREGNFAILFSLIADGLAAVPTIVKSFNFPETESHWFYLSSVISSIITLLSITTWNFAHYGFPLYIFVVNLILFTLIKFRIGKKFAQISHLRGGMFYKQDKVNLKTGPYVA